METLINKLHAEPAIRYKLAVNVLEYPAASKEAKEACEVVRNSPQVQALLTACMPDGNLPYHPYKKWDGGHWVLSVLADLGYPSGDETLRPLLEQAYDWLFSPGHAHNIRMIDGRMRRCASQESNLVYSSLTLGLADARTDELAARLMKWQWPDGGWNCDKRPDVNISSFMESLIPLRALALYAKMNGDAAARGASQRAADNFLKRNLFLRQRDGEIMDKHFVRLHYPCYWRYDILFALKVMTEAGFISDPRCQPALDLLESRRLPDGGFPADEKYYHLSQPDISGYSPVSWGAISKRKFNPYVTVEALAVLRAAGRLKLEDFKPLIDESPAKKPFHTI
ncbi:MAG: hypothetical protein A2X25_07090 [Chloroflexi bacterium GWB2_49_20]|nr:MAG: hypothetical protein A2X25_07090 [Chloroflexi bacterium GWB2_49_20]OGN77924.1 MAG: hypothetical protein A2X26_14895 [Chloroflexi bacterium GWC2_49_37]OGN84962.1 MAG: hypothetical protein A2X27_09595 [Chloroflexi bacterium GWD2_49_16]HBG75009.1 hypothetical protein [Anaerolineae bacterium]HCC79758.1 hypothetical protein [Anaerolineae bacterium]